MEQLRISDNRRYFETSNGTPFPWLADTVWTMPQRMKWDDVEYLMKRRKAQGFTVLQICALDPERDVEMRTPAGEPALIGGSLDQPNERYFEYLDYILDKAEEYGFYVLLLPVWGQLVVGDDWGGGVYEKTVREDNAYAYGRWIGCRYRSRSNILWCLGGDRMPIHKGVDYRNVWRRMAEGLAKGLTGEDVRYNEPSPVWESLMITYHACHEAETGRCSSMSCFDDSEKWISFIMLQSGHNSGPKNYELIRAEYERAHTMPVWDGEPAYEGMPTEFPTGMDVPRHGSWMVRRRAYWGLLAGGFGHTYGHASVWCSVSEKECYSSKGTPINPMSPCTWYEALSCEGAEQMRHLRAFMESLRIMTAIPCQQILLDDCLREGELDRHAQAAAAPDGNYVCVYLPSGGKAHLDLSSVWNRDEAVLWRWSPRDGKFYTGDGDPAELGEKVPVSNSLSVNAPAEGEEQDWVLLLTASETEKPIAEFLFDQEEEKIESKKVFEW